MTFLYSDFRLKYNDFRQLWHHNSWKKFTSPHKLRYTKNWLKTSEIVHQHQISSFLVILFLASNRQKKHWSYNEKIPSYSQCFIVSVWK